MNIFIFFDDTVAKSETIRDVIGEKGFAKVVIKKRCLEQYYQENLLSLFPAAHWQLIQSPYLFHDLLNQFSEEIDACIIHCFSSFIFSDKEKALLSFEKIKYIEKVYRGTVDGQPAVLMFNNVQAYRMFLKNVCTGMSTLEAAKQIDSAFSIDGMTYIGCFENFIQCITGNFDSRYFNSVSGNEYTLVKKSTNKKKIQAEYKFYRLLPDDMKLWFVMPYQYEENADTASYKMEHLHMTDLAIQWVHGSLNEMEFRKIMERYFHFFSIRHQKVISEEQYRSISNALYLEKVNKRIEEFKKCAVFDKIKALLKHSRNTSIEEIVNKYFCLKEQIENRQHHSPICVIGHGDPCFANTLYSKSAQMMKFIDPKGAVHEDELWTNPYYDIAKLSHSVCGLYDFFNTGLFQIQLDEHFQCQLKIEIEFDNQKYVDIFREQAEKNQYDYLLVRLYEVSLFLSMLPLHIDNPFKVFGFILNAEKILKELEHEIC